MKPPSRFLIFALLGPAVGWGLLMLLAVIVSLLEGGSGGHISAQALRVLHMILTPRGLMLFAPFALASWAASRLSVAAETRSGHGKRVRGLAATGALLLVSPISTVAAIVALGHGLLAPLGGLATAGAALASCWALCGFNERHAALQVSTRFS